MPTDTPAAPKEWRGRFYEDFAPGDVFRSRFGRTVTQTDNIWFTCLTMNTNPMHFSEPFAARTRFEKPLVNSAFTLALVTGPDRSGHERERGRQPRLDRHQAPEAGLRGRHALGRERDPRGARVGLEPERRDRLDALPGSQPALGGRDRVQANLHGLPSRRPRGRRRLPAFRRRMDGVRAAGRSLLSRQTRRIRCRLPPGRSQSGARRSRSPTSRRTS